MKRVYGFSLGAALAAGLLAQPAAASGPFGHGAALRSADAAPIVDIRHRPGHVPQRAKRRNNGAAVAGALIGAAIVGGAIIANSQPRRRYYDDGYYYGEPAYPQPYYYQRSRYQDDYYYQESYYPPAHHPRPRHWQRQDTHEWRGRVRRGYEQPRQFRENDP